MADYINIYGQDILAVASDPANPTQGQIWYNTTSNTLKGGGVTTAGTWATGGNLNTARFYLAGCGTQTAALGFGGELDPGTSGATEEYDGSTWTTVSSLSTARSDLAGDGNTSAALAFGGLNPTPAITAATEEWLGAGAAVTKTITVS